MTLIDPHTVEIMFAAPEDASALTEIGRFTFEKKFGHLYSEKDLQTFLREDHNVPAYEELIADPDYGVWKAVETTTGRIVGYAVGSRICGLPADEMPDRAGEVKRLYLLDECQGGGLGRQMLEVMMDWIEAEGACPIYLSVYKYNEGAQRFYQRAGFDLHKEYEFMVGDHADPEYIFLRPARA